MVTLFGLDVRLAGARAQGLLVARQGSEVVGVYAVVLLLRDGPLSQQLLVALVLAPRILHLRLGLADAGIGHGDVGLGPLNAGAGLAVAFLHASKVGQSLRQTQATLCIFDNDEGVALLDGLKFFESDFLDEALHAGVLRRDVLAHVGIVGELHLAEMGKVANDYGHAQQQEEGHDGVVKIFHKVPVVYLSL